MIRLTYNYSACITIATPDATILCDPWFSDGIYDGSWYHYPAFENPLDRLPAADIVYISHIHPDHYDPDFLQLYMARHPQARIIIADFPLNFLARVMTRDGFKPEICRAMTVGNTELAIFPNAVGDFPTDDVDSALVVKWGHHSVVNMNDNLFNPAQVAAIKAFCPEPTIAALTYTGAGPYPQTYYDIGPELLAEAERKKQQFFVRYRQMRDALDAKVNLPFAGKYTLGGRLHYLNAYRGVSDPVEVTAFDPTAIVLADGGQASIDTATLQPTALRDRLYDADDYAARIRQIAYRPMAYEALWTAADPSNIPFARLLDKAYAQALAKSRCEEDHWVCLWIGDRWYAMNAKRDGKKSELRSSVADLENRSEIHADLRHLYGLLTHTFHWNNAQIGSHLITRRYPNRHNRAVPRFLDYLAV